MKKKVTLKAITADNWEEVADLEVSDEQDDFVASNAFSIAESKFNDHAVPLAIYAGDEPVGFIMYEPQHDEDDPSTFLIYRFMVDEDHQGEGHGRAGMAALLDRLRATPACRRITICYVAGNARAKAFYASFGFKEVGTNDDGELVAEIIVGE
ncbi:MAG: GNAT family N-acetyltransferase [Pseudomonadota bacterium]